MRRAARLVGEIAALARQRADGAGRGVGFDRRFLEIGGERLVRLRGQDALRSDEGSVVVDAGIVVTLCIGDALRGGSRAPQQRECERHEAANPRDRLMMALLFFVTPRGRAGLALSIVLST